MKVAILYSGLVRTLEQTWPTVAHAFSRYQPDFYFYLNQPEFEHTVRKIVNPRLLLVEPEPILPEKSYLSRIGSGVKAIQNDLRQLYGLSRVNQLQKSTGIVYDWVIRIRTDIAFTRPPEPLDTLFSNAVYVPTFSNWLGFNDRFAIGPPELMEIYMDRFKGLDGYINRGGTFQMEGFLGYWLKLHEIPVARTCAEFDMIRDEGGREKPKRDRGWGDII